MKAKTQRAQHYTTHGRTRRDCGRPQASADAADTAADTAAAAAVAPRAPKTALASSVNRNLTPARATGGVQIRHRGVKGRGRYTCQAKENPQRAGGKCSVQSNAGLMRWLRGTGAHLLVLVALMFYCRCASDWWPRSTCNTTSGVTKAWPWAGWLVQQRAPTHCPVAAVQAPWSRREVFYDLHCCARTYFLRWYSPRPKVRSD